MRIGIDYITAYGSGGNGTYTRELSRALGGAGLGDAFFLYTYIHHRLLRRVKPDFSSQRFAGSFFPSFRMPALTELGERASRWLLARRAKWDGLDVMHFTNPLNFAEGVSPRTRVVATMHDLAWLKNSDWVKPSTHARMKKLLPTIVSRCDAIIAVSESTRQDLLLSFPEAAGRVTVIHEGASPLFRLAQHSDDGFLRRYGLLKPYVLSVGEIQPRKNLQSLLRAYAILKPDLRARYDLVLVGAPRNEEARHQLKSAIAAQSLQNCVRIAGRVSDEDLARFYQHATVFAYVSHWEGFGLPVLEAMASGTPVVASNTSSLPEVGGNACVYADPARPDAVAAQLEILLGNETLRAELKQKALARARAFSWQKAANETLAAYRSVAGR